MSKAFKRYARSYKVEVLDSNVDDKFSKSVVPYRGKNAVYKFIDAILKKLNYCKRVTNEHFNKNLVMPAEDEESFS